MRSPLPALLALFSLAIVGSACTTTQRSSARSGVARAETELAKVLISSQQEEQLGLQVREELTKQNVKYLEDPTVVQYVDGVARKVIRFAQKDRDDVKWRISVIDDPKTVNAFATPGGYLYVYTGLLLAADNEAELAGVMAHEAGHVVARHSARQLVQVYGLQAVTDMAVGKNPSLLKQLGATIASQGLLLAHSRSQEEEADTYGARYSAAAGYDPHGLVTFFQKLAAKEGKVPGVMTFLSDHPSTPDRIERVNQQIAKEGLRGTDLGADRLAPIKARVQAHVPAATSAPVAK